MRVFIVDDLPYVRRLLRDILSRAGFEIAGEAEDGISFLKAYGKVKPDLVVLDIAMPGIDGLETLRRLMRRDSRATVVMCSALGDQQRIMTAIRRGAADFVVKPFTEERIISALTLAGERCNDVKI